MGTSPISSSSESGTQMGAVYFIKKPPAPISRFLARIGFTLLTGVTTTFSWRETDGEIRNYPMQFWIKMLT